MRRGARFKQLLQPESTHLPTYTTTPVSVAYCTQCTVVLYSESGPSVASRSDGTNVTTTVSLSIVAKIIGARTFMAERREAAAAAV